jgi:hypothetical protein
MMRENLDQTARALDNSSKQAESAKEAAEETIATERARLFIIPSNIKRMGDNDPLPKIPYTIFNLGRTAALLSGTLVECKIVSIFEQPPQYNEKKLEPAMQPIAAGVAWTDGAECSLDEPITDADFLLLSKDSKIIVFMGYVKYRDVFGRRWKKRFAMVARGNGFIGMNGPGLDVSNSEEEEK